MEPRLTIRLYAPRTWDSDSFPRYPLADWVACTEWNGQPESDHADTPGNAVAVLCHRLGVEDLGTD